MAEERRGRGRKKTVDWQRVAEVLGAKDENDLITCRHCRANGGVPYLAEHILTAHPESPEGRKVRQVVSGEEPPTGARPSQAGRVGRGGRGRRDRRNHV